MAMATSRLPRREASAASSPPSRSRKMFSETTMELSTSMPTPSISPTMLITFSVMEQKYMTVTATMIEIGMATATRARGENPAQEEVEDADREESTPEPRIPKVTEGVQDELD